MVVLRQSFCIWEKWLYSDKSGCNRAKMVLLGQNGLYSGKSGCIRAKVVLFVQKWLYSFVWLFAINRTTIPRIYSCSELVCAIVDLGIVGLSVMCAHCGHNFFIYLSKT